MSGRRSRIKEWVLNKLSITRKPVVKVYNGFGDRDSCMIYGHVLRQSPLPKKKFKKNFWSNSMSLIRLFMTEPFPRVRVQLQWMGQLMEADTDHDGFFRFEWHTAVLPDPGWYPVEIKVADGKYKGTIGKGKMMFPHPTQYVFISDIDDTFLISHSANLRKRLYVLLTKNARTRKPFDGAVKHYQLLAKANTVDGAENPFFYVSSSEWNLYDYINEFKRQNELPEGVYLLSQMKQIHQFLKTGQTKHGGKFMRIVRILKEFPKQQFILLGDDTQQDPYIYHKIVEGFPGRIHCVYLRHVGRHRKPEVMTLAEEMCRLGVEVCYFKKSEDAIAHSQKIGLIKTAM